MVRATQRPHLWRFNYNCRKPTTKSDTRLGVALLFFRFSWTGSTETERETGRKSEKKRVKKVEGTRKEKMPGKRGFNDQTYANRPNRHSYLWCLNIPVIAKNTRNSAFVLPSGVHYFVGSLQFDLQFEILPRSIQYSLTITISWTDSHLSAFTYLSAARLDLNQWGQCFQTWLHSICNTTHQFIRFTLAKSSSTPTQWPKFVPAGSLIQSTAAKIYRYTQLLPAFHHKPLTLHRFAPATANG